MLIFPIFHGYILFEQTYTKDDLSSVISTNENERFYDATMKLYNQMISENQSANKDTATQRNHDFFKYQMAIQRATGDYWEGFTSEPVYKKLMASMRAATVRFLEMHGWSKADAEFKADHDLIFWASVHLAASEHQPHVTEDALLGGVYYVSLGDGEPQSLMLYDPRGKKAVDLTAENAKELPEAPFHRSGKHFVVFLVLLNTDFYLLYSNNSRGCPKSRKVDPVSWVIGSCRSVFLSSLCNCNYHCNEKFTIFC